MLIIPLQYTGIAFALIDIFLLSAFLAWELLLFWANFFGYAWWAKVKTHGPGVTYWFGPFLTKNSLETDLSKFIEELSEEGSTDIKYEILRCKSDHQLTSFSNNETELILDDDRFFKEEALLNRLA